MNKMLEEEAWQTPVAIVRKLEAQYDDVIEASKHNAFISTILDTILSARLYFKLKEFVVSTLMHGFSSRSGIIPILLWDDELDDDEERLAEELAWKLVSDELLDDWHSIIQAAIEHAKTDDDLMKKIEEDASDEALSGMIRSAVNIMTDEGEITASFANDAKKQIKMKLSSKI